MHEAKVLNNGQEGRGLFGLLSQAVRQEGSVFCSAATARAFSWGSLRQNGERLLQGRRGGTGKCEPWEGRSEGAHTSVSGRERSWSVWGWLSGTQVLADRNKTARH